jgi:hypothetical protein
MAQKALSCWCGEPLQATKGSYFDLTPRGWRPTPDEPSTWIVHCAAGHQVIATGLDADVEGEALEAALRKAATPKGRKAMQPGWIAPEPVPAAEPAKAAKVKPAKAATVPEPVDA